MTRTYATFDWCALIDKLGGDEDFVLGLLEVALRSNEPLPAELRAAGRAGDLGALARVAHKVKGTAGDLVALPLQSRAREAELAARSGEPAAIALGAGLADALEALLVELRALLATRG